MKTFVRTACALTSFLFVSIVAGSAMADTTITVTAKNDTSAFVNAIQKGCIGNWAPPPGQLNPGGSYNGEASSTNPVANSCQLRLERDDNLRYCEFVLTRTRSSLNGPWNYPTINVNQSSSGVTCNKSITSVGSNGDWKANVSIAP